MDIHAAEVLVQYCESFKQLNKRPTKETGQSAARAHLFLRLVHETRASIFAHSSTTKCVIVHLVAKSLIHLEQST